MSDCQISYNQFLLKKQQILMAGQPDLPTDYEVIVIGTGLEESIVAAAVARNGHSVLHIDTKDYYGEDWASFNFRALQDWITSQSSEAAQKQTAESTETDEQSLKNLLKEGEKIHLLDTNKSITNVKETWHCAENDESIDKSDVKSDNLESDTTDTKKNDGDSEESKASPNVQERAEDEVSNETSEDKAQEAPLPKKIQPSKPKWTKSKIIEERMFNIDLTSRLLYSRGAMVDLLIQSNISRYTEFKSVSRVLTVLNGTIEYVPSSRADVFSTKHVSVVEKRILMKYLKFCIDYQNHPEIYENYVNRTYHDFLKHEKLTDNLIHFVMHSIAMVEADINTLEGLEATQKFLSSLGRFGNTPFLYSSFGSGELPQAFCRLCAVFGGTYYLGRSIEALITDDTSGKCVGIISNGLRINCQKLVMGGRTCPTDLKEVKSDQKQQPVEVIERKICLTTESILPSEKEQLTFLSVPPNKSDDSDAPGDSYTYVTEAGHGASVCPRGMYCLHLTKAKQNNTDTSYLQKSFQTLIPAEKQNSLLWTLDFNITTENFEATKSTEPNSNQSLFLTSGPHFELDYDITIENARNLYANMFPEEPFLPRAPDPEEIILGGDPAGGEEEEEDENPEKNSSNHDEEQEKNSSNRNEGEKDDGHDSATTNVTTAEESSS